MWNAGPGLHFNDFSILKNIVFFSFPARSWLWNHRWWEATSTYTEEIWTTFEKNIMVCVVVWKTDIMDFVDFSGGNQFIYAYQRPPWPLTGRSGTRGGIVGTVRLENNRKKGRKMK